MARSCITDRIRFIGGELERELKISQLKGKDLS